MVDRALPLIWSADGKKHRPRVIWLENATVTLTCSCGIHPLTIRIHGENVLGAFSVAAERLRTMHAVDVLRIWTAQPELKA